MIPHMVEHLDSGLDLLVKFPVTWSLKSSAGFSLGARESDSNHPSPTVGPQARAEVSHRRVYFSAKSQLPLPGERGDPSGSWEEMP